MAEAVNKSNSHRERSPERWEAGRSEGCRHESVTALRASDRAQSKKLRRVSDSRFATFIYFEPSVLSTCLFSSAKHRWSRALFPGWPQLLPPAFSFPRLCRWSATVRETLPHTLDCKTMARKSTAERVDDASPQIKAELLARRKAVVPKAFSDGQLDLEPRTRRPREALGEVAALIGGANGHTIQIGLSS